MTPVGAARPRAVVLVLATAGIVSSLVFSLAIPLAADFAAIFDASPAAATWIIVANSVANAVATPIAGRMGDLWGPRRTLLATTAVLALGSLVCAAAPSLPVMLLGRVLQGAAAGTVPLGIGILRAHLDPARASGAVGVLGATLGIGSGAGITLAGFLLEHGGWRVVFGSTAVLAALVVVLVAVAVPRDPGDRRREPVDLVGGAGLAAALVLLLVPLSMAVDWGWLSPRTIGSLGTGCLVGWAWWRHQRRHPLPMVDVRLAVSTRMVGINLLCVIAGASIFFSLLTAVTVVQAPTSISYGLGRSALIAGLALIPGNLMMLVLPGPTARLAGSRGARLPIRLGMAFMAVGYLGRFLVDDSVVAIAVGYLVVQVGVALILAGLPIAIFGSAPAAQTAAAQAIGTTMRQVGIATAGAFFAALVAARQVVNGHQVLPSPTALTTAYLVAAGIALVGIGATWVRLPGMPGPGECRAAP